MPEKALLAYEETTDKYPEIFELVLDRIRDPVFVKNEEQTLIHANSAFCILVGKPRDELIGKTISELRSVNPNEFMFKQEELNMEAGKECTTEEEIEDAQGRKRVFAVTRDRFTDKAGKRYVVGFMRDISEYKLLKTQFLQAQKMEPIGILVGGVMHDLNNMLNIVNGYSEMLLEDLDEDDPRGQDLEKIREAGLRAGSLTSQLLAFTRKQISSPQDLNLNELVYDLKKMLRRLISEDVELVCNTQEGIELIRADSCQIQQLIMNLAANARYAMPAGGKLTIETARISFAGGSERPHEEMTPGAYVLLAVSDDGTGMDAVTKARLFDPVFAAATAQRGTGLGLSAVYEIVEQAGGFIKVHSEQGKGTSFRIYFPCGEKTVLRAEKTKGKASGDADGETVLLAEDESMVRSLLARMLINRGYKVLEAADGREALRLFEDHAGKVSLVVADVVMPVMSGTELVERIFSVRPGLPALFVSGYMDNRPQLDGLSDSNAAFIQKPFTADSFLCKVREVIDGA